MVLVDGRWLWQRTTANANEPYRLVGKSQPVRDVGRIEPSGDLGESKPIMHMGERNLNGRTR